MDNYNIPKPAIEDSFRSVPMPRPGEIAGIAHEVFAKANENDQMASGCISIPPMMNYNNDNAEEANESAAIVNY